VANKRGGISLMFSQLMDALAQASLSLARLPFPLLIFSQSPAEARLKTQLSRTSAKSGIPSS